MRNTLMIIMALVLAVGVVGCKAKKEKAGNVIGNKIAETIAEQALKNSGQEGKVSITEDGVNIQSDKGNFKMSTGENLTVPADFPKVVPIYANAKVAQVMTTPEGANLILNTPDAQADVVKFYKDKLEGAGWTSQMAMQLPTGEMMAYQKDTEMISVMVGRSEDSTVMTVTYGKSN